MHPATRAVFVGDGTLLIRCAQAFLEAGHTVVAVASGHAAVLDWARQQQLPAVAIGQEGLKLPEAEFDYLFSIANLRVLPPQVLARARKLALNFHDGPLPRHAGLNAPAWALMANEPRHGITWHEMTAQVDAGRIARQVLFDLAPDETAFSLNARCYEAGFQAFRQLLAELGAGTLALTPQAGTGSLHGRHQRPEALATLDWQRPAAELHALVRGLDFGTYANPLALPKLWLGDRLLVARSARLAEPAVSQLPGTVLEVAGERLCMATGRGALWLEGCRSLDGKPALAGLRVGDRLPPLPSVLAQALAERQPRLARAEPHWRDALDHLAAVSLPYPRRAEGPGSGDGLDAVLPVPGAPDAAAMRLQLEATASAGLTLAGFAAWLSALAGQPAVSLCYSDATLADQAQGLENWASAWVPLRLETQPGLAVPQARAAAEAAVAQARQAGPMTADLRLRLGGAEGGPALPEVGLSLGGMPPAADGALRPVLWLHAPQAGAALALHVCPRAYTPQVAHVMARSLDAWLQAFARAGGPVCEVPLLTAQEAAQRDALNATEVPLDTRCGVPALIAQAARARAGEDALRWHERGITHHELQQRSDALARVLRERGAGEGKIVGLCLERTPELVVALLAILKSGAAYLPLDPDYPRERLRFMLEDSGARLVVCSEATRALLALPPEQAVAPGTQPAQPAAELPEVPGSATAYVIYTSGSTGQPKGVKVTHANVLNFFAGMDRRVPHEGGGRWLAVTSLSFDISVLELLWTLARGFTVVLHSAAPAPEAAAPARAPEFSLFYFASDESRQGRERYRLLLEGARFADANGFAAVWTPERHFHAFGGLYPNPAVTSAALAAMTTRVQIRAGSCVSPLHSAVRIAEDWSLVDNLSGGRVGVSFAAGWQPNDFVLAPQAFARRKELMLEQVDTVRRLWAGEAVDFPGHDGKPVPVRTLPRPVQKELPIWLTAAGNPETFMLAGRMGCHLLTHLLGQTVEDVAAKVALYHQAWREAGHPGRGQVTMMLHTFVGEDEDAVRETARGPMKAYLRSSVDLIRQAAWSFPTFVQRGAADGRTPLQVMDAQPLSEGEMDALLDHAFSRYWNTSALIGTPERCLAMVHRLQDAGVDEIACLIDFGIETETALAHLQHLHRLLQLAQQPRRAPAQAGAGPASVAEAMARHQVTHLQCTPSMATMLVADGAGRAALGHLSALLVGGEALPLALARELREQVPGALLNMYGPTETTVWSTCCALQEVEGFVPLGEPIANTRLVLRNAWGQDCPALVPGELLIGGAGVTPGYLGRPELTAERFIPDPADPQGQARLYRTGDLVRAHPDGRLEFLGRLDHQVKIRGHRIELGEIEAALQGQAGVREAVVVACRDATGEAFLAAFVTPRGEGPAPEGEALRQALVQALPAIMVPRSVTVRESLPLTPNGKTDRQALARLGPPTAPSTSPSTAPSTAPSAAAPHPAGGSLPLEQAIAAIWCEVLGRPEVGRDSNFFDLGGHSLLVIQVQRRLREALGQEIALTDMFRLTTVAAIAAHLQGQRRDTAVSDGQSRAQARRALRGHGVGRAVRG